MNNRIMERGAKFGNFFGIINLEVSKIFSINSLIKLQ